MANEVECVQPQQSTVVVPVSKKQLEEVLCFTGTVNTEICEQRFVCLFHVLFSSKKVNLCNFVCICCFHPFCCPIEKLYDFCNFCNQVQSWIYL